LKRSNRVLLLLGVGLAVVAFIGVLSVGSMGQAPAAPQVETVTVVVAAQDLPIGTALTTDMLTTEERPVPQAADTYATPSEVAGSVIRRSVVAGYVLRTTDFDNNQTQVDLAASIGAGLRAIAVSLDEIDGVGMLVQPGDYVDVVLTMPDESVPISLPNPKYPTESEEQRVSLDTWINNTTVKVLVQNVQVVAIIDPRLAETNDVSTGTFQVATLVAVLAVNPQQVELVRYAQRAGELSLVMRSPSDRTAGEVPTSGITLAELVNSYGVLPPAPVTP
jgi:pilus assembly protein CpaB